MGKSSVVLLVILAGLLGVYQFYLKDKPFNVTNSQDTAMPSIEPAIDLVDAEKDAISKLSWQFSANEYGEMEQFETGKWRMVRPSTVQIDMTKADNLASSVIALNGTPRIQLSESFKLDSVGLASGYGTVTVERKDGVKEVLRFGNTAIGDSQVYVHKEGTDFATLVYSYQVTELKKQPTDLEPDPSASPAGS